MQFCFYRVDQHHVRLEVLVGEVEVIRSLILQLSELLVNLSLIIFLVLLFYLHIVHSLFERLRQGRLICESLRKFTNFVDWRFESFDPDRIFL